MVISTLRKNVHRFNIVGFTDIKEDAEAFLGIPCLGNDDVLAEIATRSLNYLALLGIGIVRQADIDKRVALQKRLNALGFLSATVVSPLAIVNEEVFIGAGTVVFDGAVINCGSTVGKCAIINSGAIVEHDCRIGEHVHIAPGVTLCGSVEIGDKSCIGAGSTVVQNVSIAPGCMVGAGSLVLGNIKESGTYVGSPVRRIQ